MYSKEEIEEKRRQAILKQQQKNVPSTNQTSLPSSGLSVNNFYKNQNTPNSGLKAKSFYQNQNNITPFNNSSTFRNPNVIRSHSPSKRFSPMNRSQNFDKRDEKIVVSCQLISKQKFIIESSKFSTELNDLCKTIPSRAYDSNTKWWSFNLNDYTMLCEKIVALQTLEFQPLPSVILQTFRNPSKKETDISTIDLSKIDESLRNGLYPFQKEGIQFGISKNGRCLIADDMGLGKTRQALGIAHYYIEDWPLLIIAPSSVKYQWKEAIIDNLKTVPIMDIEMVQSAREELENKKITIISYDLLKHRVDELANRKYGVIICDESHYLKSGIKTVRYQAVSQIAQRTKRLILLTGTPALSRPMELFAQVNLLVKNFMSWRDYGTRYCAGVQTKFCFDVSGSSNPKELELFLKSSCLLRRLKRDVMEQLPSKIRQKILLDPAQVDKKRKELETANKKMAKSGLTGSQRQAVMFEFYKETSLAKEKAICNYISDLLENDDKFLIFAHHSNLIDAICNLLDKKKVGYMKIDGKTPPYHRKENVDRFQNDQKCMVAVLSIMAANAGITLTAARLVIFAELSWNPGILCQAEDRVHRIGQTNDVVIRYLIAQNTADDLMWPAVQNKIDVLNTVGLDQNFDLSSTDTSKQASNQETLDKFFETDFADDDFKSPEKSSGENKNQTIGLQEMLDDDDAAFDEIDLDSIGAA